MSFGEDISRCGRKLHTLSFFRSAYLTISTLSPAARQLVWFKACRAAVACAIVGYDTNKYALRGFCCCSGTTTVGGPNSLKIWLTAALSMPTPGPQLPTNKWRVGWPPFGLPNIRLRCCRYCGFRKLSTAQPFHILVWQISTSILQQRLCRCANRGVYIFSVSVWIGFVIWDPPCRCLRFATVGVQTLRFTMSQACLACS